MVLMVFVGDTMGNGGLGRWMFSMVSLGVLMLVFDLGWSACLMISWDSILVCEWGWSMCLAN